MDPTTTPPPEPPTTPLPSTPLPTTLPDPRRPDPRSVPVLRWGVLGTGWIAHRFVDSLQRNTDQQVVAVGSRTTTAARAFAHAHGLPRAHGDLAGLVGDPGVDVVYVATPHAAHREGALAAVAAGRHVLVEKPLGLDAQEAAEVAAAAAAAGVFCAEALWTAFLPRFDVVRQVLEQGLLGEVRTVLADHGEPFAPPHRILDPAAAGGSLLDLGSYCTALATWVLGAAQRVQASGEDTPGGVNGQAAILLEHAGGARSVLHTTLLTRTPTTAVIAGTGGVLTLPGPWMMPGDVVLSAPDGRPRATWTDPDPVGHGALFHSALEVAVRVGNGDLTTPLRPPADVLTGTAALEAAGRLLGVSYLPVR